MPFREYSNLFIRAFSRGAFIYIVIVLEGLYSKSVGQYHLPPSKIENYTGHRTKQGHEDLSCTRNGVAKINTFLKKLELTEMWVLFFMRFFIYGC